MVRLGGWLFRHRTILPLPIAFVLLLVPPSVERPAFFWIGMAIVGIGEWIRVWAVRHIGTISRTRSDRLGPLVASGPFAWIRNPLYLGNLLLWLGLTVSAQLVWLLPVVVVLLAFEYHAIVRWEEHLIESRLGEAYREYTFRVPRWIPSSRPAHAGVQSSVFSLRETLFSERGTLIAIAAGYLLLLLKSQLLA